MIRRRSVGQLARNQLPKKQRKVQMNQPVPVNSLKAIQKRNTLQKNPNQSKLGNFPPRRRRVVQSLILMKIGVRRIRVPRKEVQ